MLLIIIRGTCTLKENEQYQNKIVIVVIYINLLNYYLMFLLPSFTHYMYQRFVVKICS